METKPSWSENFFSGLIVEAQRRLSFPEQTQAESEFLWQALALGSGSRIADVPCGNGRLSLALAAKGLRVTGVDSTSELLDDARRAAAEQCVPAEFEERDMRDLPWPLAFDGAFCFGNSFSYFDDAGNLAFLQAVRGILKPGGKFVLETHFVAETLFSQIMRKRWFEFEDVLCLHDTQYEPRTGQLTSTYRMLRGDQKEQKQAVYQVYLCRDVLRMLSEAGFEHIESFGSLSREPFQIGSSGLYLVAS